MKPTKIKVSVSQDGLLPEETAELASVDFPVFQKKLLKALGFERVDSETFVGVLPDSTKVDRSGPGASHPHLNR